MYALARAGSVIAQPTARPVRISRLRFYGPASGGFTDEVVVRERMRSVGRVVDVDVVVECSSALITAGVARCGAVWGLQVSPHCAAADARR